MSFQFERLEIPEVICIRARLFPDDRGYFKETYKHSVFSANGISDVFVQDNHSHSRLGVLRGLHYQKEPMAQAKLVTVLQGEVFDVAVDVRRGSPTYGKWVGMTLSADSPCMLYVPVGFAHGYCALSEQADVLYKVTKEYAPDLERGILWNDPDIGIRWPISDPHLSSRDAQFPSLSRSDNSFVYQGR